MTQLTNLHCLVSPTHHFGGLSIGNTASMCHEGQVSSPKKAALDSLNKIKYLHELGIPQIILPPHERPDIGFLRKMGFIGTPKHILETAFLEAPELLSIACSSAAMWTIDTVPVTPASDTRDGRVHMTPANLISFPHRAIEAAFTTKLLRQTFKDPSYFAIHDPLPGYMPDEGMANVLRLAHSLNAPANYAFIHSPKGVHTGIGRQSKLAFQHIARHHGLAHNRVRYYSQNHTAIQAGVFHNDVISFSCPGGLFTHESAFAQTVTAEHMHAVYSYHHQEPLFVSIIPQSRLSLDVAVRSYIFNSQAVPCPDGRIVLIVPSMCMQHSEVMAVIQEWVDTPLCPITEFKVMDLSESMANGGGPACLRLPVILENAALNTVPTGQLYNLKMDTGAADYPTLYPDSLLPLKDLSHGRFYDDCCVALDAISSCLELGSIYQFQGPL